MQETKRNDDKVFGVNVLIQKDGLVLGVARRKDPNDFSLPGGKVDPGETPEEACVREIREETGLEISNLKEIYRGLCVGDLVITYACDSTHLNAESQPGEPECRWVHPEVPAFGVFGEYNRELFKKMNVIF